MSDPHLTHSIFGGSEHAGATVRKRRRHRGPVGCLVVLLALLLVGGAAFYAVGQLKPMVKSLVKSGPEDYTAQEKQAEKVNVTIASGQSASQIGANLVKAGVVKSSAAFVTAANASEKWSALQPGTYAIAKKSPAQDAVAAIVDPKNKVSNLVTVREGLRKWEVYELLSQKTGHPVSEYEQAEERATELGLPKEAKGDVEGWLYPSSYEFTKATSAADQLKAMFAQGVATTSKLGISPEELERTVIVASIVEAEGKLDADRPKIARVIDNRVEKGQRLQMDSTVVYPLRKRVLATTDEDRKQVNGYNTYTHDGLPKGPIANPGEASLKAAANPTPGPWLYFVAVNPVTGETKFAETFAEHEKYVAEWQTFCRENPGSC